MEKTFTFSATQDSVDDDDESVIIGFKTSDSTWPSQVTTVAPDMTTVSITDNDTRGITVAPTSLRIVEGSTGRYTVVLDSEPTADVTVKIGAPINTDITVDSMELIFTPSNWDEPQEVTVTAAADDMDAEEDTGTITHTVSGGDYDSVGADEVSVTVDDDEVSVSFEQADILGHGRRRRRHGHSPAQRPRQGDMFTIDLVKTEDGATEDDYSGLPDQLMFAPSATPSKRSASARLRTLRLMTAKACCSGSARCHRA